MRIGCDEVVGRVVIKSIFQYSNLMQLIELNRHFPKMQSGLHLIEIHGLTKYSKIFQFSKNDDDVHIPARFSVQFHHR